MQQATSPAPKLAQEKDGKLYNQPPENAMPADFQFPAGASANVAAKALASICASPAWLELYPYLPILDARFQNNRTRSESPKIRPILNLLLHEATRPLRRLAGKKGISEGDVLVVGESERSSDIRMMEKLVSGLVRSGRKVLYLSRSGSAEHAALSQLITRSGMNGQVSLLDPYAELSLCERLLRRICQDHYAYNDYLRLLSLLPDELGLKLDSFGCVQGVARIKAAWDLIEPRLRFNAVILRNHWSPLSAVVAARTATSGKEVVTFQHGVISSPTCFFPVVATRCVCFGRSSGELLKAIDKQLAGSTNREHLCRDVVLGGSLFDEITTLPVNIDMGSVLVIDQANPWAGEYYGIEKQFQTLVEVVEALAKQAGAVKKIIIRRHPDNAAMKGWLELLANYPHVEVSGSASSLDDDLARSSVVLGLFSGALVTAAACGIPALFLWEQGWYYTPDLASFAPHAFVSPASVIERLEELLSDRSIYQAARTTALETAACYYHENKSCNFEPEFVDRLLAVGNLHNPMRSMF